MTSENDEICFSRSREHRERPSAASVSVAVLWLPAPLGGLGCLCSSSPAYVSPPAASNDTVSWSTFLTLPSLQCCVVATSQTPKNASRLVYGFGSCDMRAVGVIVTGPTASVG